MKEELAQENGAGSEQPMNPVLQPIAVSVELDKATLADISKDLKEGSVDFLGSQERPACGGVVEDVVKQGVTPDATCPAADLVSDLNVAQELGNCTANDTPPELGPFVNPSDVQEGQGILLSINKATDSTRETKLNKSHIHFQKTDASGGSESEADKDLDRNAVLKDIEVSEVEIPSLPKGKGDQDQNDPTKKLPKSKQGNSPVRLKKKQRPSSPVSAETGSSPVQSKRVMPNNIESIPTTEGQQIAMATKRQTDQLKTYPPSKKQRMQASQDGRPANVYRDTPKKQLLLLGRGQKSPEPTHSLLSSRPLPPASGPDRPRDQYSEQQQPGISTSVQSYVGPRPQNPQSAPSRLSNPKLECSEVEEQEKGKMKKTEKTLQRQRSRSDRSLSLEDPPLFIPDNAPMVKPEAHEKDSIDSETVWDPTKHCAFCKKPHNNRFMVGCGRCDDWFHGECVRLDLAKAQQMEQEDQEYVCLKCCAEEDGKSDTLKQAPPENPTTLEHSLESKPMAKQDKQRLAKPPTAGVQIVKRDSVERRQHSTSKTETKRPSDSDRKGGQTVRTGLSVDMPLKTAKLAKCPSSSPATSTKPSVEQIRRNVRDSLKDILLKRLNESDLKVSTERAAKVAMKTERELFAFFRDTDSKYKSKYRSLMFNLKDVKNNVLFKRVLKGEISPDSLIHMSPEELASKELAAWRKRENRHTIEMIEKEQREVERRPITKITHKGEIEIENQEPVQEQEIMEVELEPVPKPVEDPEVAPQEMESESPKDTTNQHKDHLFDLGCKICTGRMAPPVEDAATKVMKVATTVMWRQPGSDEETGCTAIYTPADSGQPLNEVEETLETVTARVFSSEGRTNVGLDEVMFLARMQSLWTGFINMPSVAKFVTKAYPVSGILDYLTEGLPDSIQVGGRISPQTVWDYVEKIRALGTKEICLIRFNPVTEEDEISYTLLYAYFSSRKRYGVVANNMKQVKDMYLIPLGSSEKIQHHLVPFDGPGLEAKRPNLLLGLIIRQRVKRDFEVVLPAEVPETYTARPLPEKNRKSYSTNDEAGAHSDLDYLSSLKKVCPKLGAKAEESTQDEVAEHPVNPTTLATEASQHDPGKPLRFLPGVLSSPTLSLVSNLHHSLQCAAEKEADKRVAAGDGIAKGNTPSKNLGLSSNRLERFVVKKKDSKTFQMELATSNPNKPKSSMTNAALAFHPRENPQNISTMSCVSGLSVAQVDKELDRPGLQKDGSLGEQAKLKPEGRPGFVAAFNRPAENILSAISEASKNHCSSSRASAHQGYSNQPPVFYGKSDDILGSASAALSFRDQTDHNPSHLSVLPTPSATVFPQGGHEPPQCTYPPSNVGAPELQYHGAAPLGFPMQRNTAYQPQYQQVPSSVHYPNALPPTFPQTDPQGQNNAPWSMPAPHSVSFSSSQQASPGLALSCGSGRFAAQSSPQLLVKGHQEPEQRYSDYRNTPYRHSMDGYKQENSTHHGSNRFHSTSHHEWKNMEREAP